MLQRSFFLWKERNSSYSKLILISIQSQKLLQLCVDISELRKLKRISYTKKNYSRNKYSSVHTYILLNVKFTRFSPYSVKVFVMSSLFISHCFRLDYSLYQNFLDRVLPTCQNLLDLLHSSLLFC